MNPDFTYAYWAGRLAGCARLAAENPQHQAELNRAVDEYDAWTASRDALAASEVAA